jgi:DNA-binding NarL/FixJ family response regulator
MGLALKDFAASNSAPRWGSLPPRMRVLFITSYHRTGGWLAEAFSSDSAVEVVLEEALGVTAGMARLRDEVFDAVLVSHEPGELDGLELLEGLRTGGSEEPLIVLGAQSEQEFSPLCYEVGADAYVCVNATTTRHLIWTVARAVQRHHLMRENRRLSQADAHRLKLEHHEAQRLLDEQRSLVRDLESIYDPSAAGNDSAESLSLANQTIARHAAAEAPCPLPAQLIEHYRELLRAYIIMGSGNLADEMSALASLLASVGISAPQTMQLHLQVLEELVRGLGSRSARHVMTRADLLVLEVMIHLTEGYRQRAIERQHPPQQLALPGFDEPCPPVFAYE